MNDRRSNNFKNDPVKKELHYANIFNAQNIQNKLYISYCFVKVINYYIIIIIIY